MANRAAKEVGVPFYSGAQIAEALPYTMLVRALRSAFADKSVVPQRSMLAIEGSNGAVGTLALMPAWQTGRAIAVKLATLFPGNANLGLPTIHALVAVFNADTGKPSAVLDGTELTRRRTAAMSALAATYLARADATRLLVVGTGAQAPHNALAHAAVLPIESVEVWGRSLAKAQFVRNAILAERPDLSVATMMDLDEALGRAHVISCATSASTPIVHGRHLVAGTMLDLVGSHTADRRECDSEAVRRSRAYVDTMSGAMAEAGDILIPIQQAEIDERHIIGDLHSLCRQESPGRLDAMEITLFKSVGTALADLTAACVVLNRAPCATELPVPLQKFCIKSIDQ